MTDQGQDTVWHLSSCLEYEDSGRGMPQPKARIEFCWDRKAKCFEIVTTRLGVPVTKRLPMSLELAEKFLLQCHDAVFGKCFLLDSTPTARFDISIGLAVLSLERQDAQYYGAHNVIYPALEMTVKQDGRPTEHLSVCHDLRTGLGNHLLRLKPEDITANLRMREAV